MGADDVTRSVGLYRKLYKNNNYKVDAHAYGKARVFDMFVGDWGKHEDNWKWAGYNNGKKRIYYPIPRDRDHTFSRWNGIIPFIADREWAAQNVENFDYDFHDMRSLNWPARHVDRFLLPPLNRMDWKILAEKIQSEMTDEVIEKAIASLPVEIQSNSGIEIAEKLKSRRSQLPEAVDKYYLMLSKYVDVVGSNKKEHIEVERLSTGNVHVQMFKESKESNDTLFDRVFIPKVTEEIRIYGLDGRDVINITGESEKSILLRIIGGPGHDEINDKSKVRGIKKHTQIYDTKGTKLTLSAESREFISDKPDINKYDRTAFKYNTYLPKPLIYYSTDDGLIASIGVRWTMQGFRKEDYKSKHEINIKAGSEENAQFKLNNRWHHVIGKWDVGFSADYGYFYPYYNFFGFGNNTNRDESLLNAEYYKVRVMGFSSSLIAEYLFLRKSIFGIDVIYENNLTDNLEGTILDNSNVNIPGNEHLSLAGAKIRLNIDLRDREIFATRGWQFNIENSEYMNLDGNNYFGLADYYIKFFGTVKVPVPVTLALKIGGSNNHGDNVPFYKSAYLGHYNNLRGFRKNRFTGDASSYLNSELRFHLGEIDNSFLPFDFGIISFYDIGKVWYNGEDNNVWHSGYGGGFYVIPIFNDYLLSFLIESSSEEKILYRFGIGFVLDK